MVRVRELAGVASVAFAAMGIAMALQAAHIAPSGPFSRLQTPVVRVAANDIAVLSLKSLRSDRGEVDKTQRLAQAQMPASAPPDQAEEVALRVRESVPAHLYPFFDIYLYVSKAARGPWAQQMYVFHKGYDGQLVFEQSFPVSTGREMREKYFTSTPTGLFELDPNRFDRVHYSRVWHHAPMPWAMFLNYIVHGRQAGIALHSAVGHEAELGHRASGGCVRLPPEKAELLFQRFQQEEAGLVPIFALDPVRNTTSVDGQMLEDATGDPLLAGGYKVLLIVQDYPGGPVVLASVS